MQLVRSNSRRFVPSQADEEVHQLSYLQKHLSNILSLLADSVEGEGQESQVCCSCFRLSYFLFGYTLIVDIFVDVLIPSLLALVTSTFECISLL